MKKLLFIIALCLPVLVSAKKKIDDSKYLCGAVPEHNGVVTFTKSFKVPGYTQEQIHNVLQPWVKKMVDNSISAPGPYARIMQDENHLLCAKICEWMTFKDKFLVLDQTRFRFQLNIEIQDEKVAMTITSISYQYGADPQTEEGGELYRAEEWITDKWAVNKKCTKLYPKSAKFRRKTVDRAESLFESAMDEFEREEEAPVVVQKKRKVVVD